MSTPGALSGLPPINWPIEARCAAVALTLAGIGYLTTLNWWQIGVTVGIGLLLVGLVSDRER